MYLQFSPFISYLVMWELRVQSYTGLLRNPIIVNGISSVVRIIALK